MQPSETRYVLLQLRAIEVRSTLGDGPGEMPRGVVGVLPVYRSLVELQREHGVAAKYAVLSVGEASRAAE